MAQSCFNMRIGIAFLGALAIAAAAVRDVPAQQAAPQFGGTYGTLDARRQHLVDNWVARFNSVTGQKVEPGPFYDDIVAFSTKTTFEAVTNALMQSSLTDAGTSLGEALSLIDRIDAVHGKIPGGAAITSSGCTCGSRRPRSIRSQVEPVPARLRQLRLSQGLSPELS